MRIKIRIIIVEFTKTPTFENTNPIFMTQMQSLLIAEDEIKPYLIIFKGCYERAIVNYNALLNFIGRPLYNRTKAINFQDIIVNEIKEAFSNDENTTIIEKYESISLVINNHISARFKKFNTKGMPSNHRSGRNDAIISQQLELGFVDYPPIARIDVGYNMDITGTGYELLKVMCRRYNDVIWDLYFHDIDDVQLPIQEVQPIEPDITTTEETRRAKPKEEKKDKKAE